MPDSHIKLRIANLREEIDYAMNLTAYILPLEFIKQRQTAIARLEKLLG